MNKYLVSVPHDAEHNACVTVVRRFLQTGSHYLTNADWGCQDGDHTAWMMVEGNDREEVKMIVPPPLRSQARVVQIKKFTMDEIEQIDREYQNRIQNQEKRG